MTTGADYIATSAFWNRSINAVIRTYDLAIEHPDLATAWSSLSNRRVNRFLHITESVEEVVAQNKMQRRLGQFTGTCFQRCVGMDALNALYSITSRSACGKRTGSSAGP